MDFEMLEFDLKYELHNFVESQEHKALEKGLKLSLDTTEVTSPNIITDPGRLRQILINLVGNALKFTQEGQIRITASLLRKDNVHGELRLEVSDTGIGIETEKVSTLFEAFTQGDGSTTRKYGGTGLGLSIVKRLCDLMEGSISVASIPGKGSTFTIHLMVKLGSDQIITHDNSQTTHEQSAWPSDTRILLVEDNPTNQIVASGMLEMLGLHADIAANGIEAIEAIRISNDTQPYSIVFMDCQMPQMDGYDATRAIRSGKAGESNKQIPIVAMTANVMQGDREKCVDAGMDDYIPKPINLSTIESALIQWVLKEEAMGLSNSHQSSAEQTVPLNLTLWDESDALKRLGNNGMLLGKILKSFINYGPLSLSELRTALDENNRESAQLHAHSLKGAAGNVSALKLQNIANILEEAAKNGNISEVQKGFDECERTLNETLTLLKTYLEKNTKPVTRAKHFDPLQMAIKLQILKKDLEDSVYIDTEDLRIFVEYSDEAFNAKMQALKESIEQFDTDNAITILEGIMAGLE